MSPVAAEELLMFVEKSPAQSANDPLTPKSASTGLWKPVWRNSSAGFGLFSLLYSALRRLLYWVIILAFFSIFRRPLAGYVHQNGIPRLGFYFTRY